MHHNISNRKRFKTPHKISNDLTTGNSISVTYVRTLSGEHIHRCTSRQIFGDAVAKVFCPDFPKLAQKILDLHKKLSMSIRRHVTSKRRKTVPVKFGRNYFQIKACWPPFLLRFSRSFRRLSEILPGFYTSHAA